MKERRIFVAGSTGATGRELLGLAEAKGRPDLVPYARPSPHRTEALDPGTRVFELADSKALDAALEDCTTVLQLIGTVRARFEKGDTYESSDIATTRALVESARRVGIDHFVLLSAVGAGTPVGAYLEAKAKVEALVRAGSVPFTIFRPSTFEGGRQPHLPGVSKIARAIGLAKFAPIELAELARAILWVARARGAVGEVLEGKSLWQVVEAARKAVG